MNYPLYEYPLNTYPLNTYPLYQWRHTWPARLGRWQVLAPSSVDVVYDTVGEADTGAHAMEVSPRCPVTWGTLRPVPRGLLCDILSARLRDS